MSTDKSIKFLSPLASLLSLGRICRRVFTPEEQAWLHDAVRRCDPLVAETAEPHGLPKSVLTIHTALIFASAIDEDHNVMAALLLARYAIEGALPTDDEFRSFWGDDVADLIEGLIKISHFSASNLIANQDNYRGLLLAMAGDIRVVIMQIVRCLAVMRLINHHPDEDWTRQQAFEANYLYAQLAHKLGLYKVKGELEDLALKYTNREVYSRIAHTLNATKRERDAYISAFITPVKERLEAAGLKFEIKGRTKSISSIWAKIQKQKVDLSGIYDLFAIRVIIDTPVEKEKSDCWLAYSIVADMYMANPSRMKDWISIPKSNGYESLHATVNGPGNKWVEVQFRTRRMDEVAEKGLAAHWRYKGGHDDSSDAWMRNIRDILETASSGPMELVKNTKKEIFSKEVFVFTPKGDVVKLPLNSTVLDFAFNVHTNVGSHCTGAVVNGRHEKITYRLRSGDTVEVKTSSTQSPKQDWLNLVVTSKARNKIRQSINEEKNAKATLGKELFERRAKNRKIDIDEAILMRMVKKAGYKFANDFFADIQEERLDASKVLADYIQMAAPEGEESVKISAEEYRIRPGEQETEVRSQFADVVTIGEGSIRGMKYKFPKCCSPVYGDDVFGFISLTGVVNIHKCDCPNAPYIRQRYADRLIQVRWSGQTGSLFSATLQVTGIDDIGIVTNITSIINKEAGAMLRNISIDSHDGLFQGYLTVGVKDTVQLRQLIKKIQGVKGVRNVAR